MTVWTEEPIARPLETAPSPSESRFATPRETYLERSLPFRELSELAYAERRAGGDAYGLHRWWARRPGSVFRGLLLAAVLPANTDPSVYWHAFSSSNDALAGLRVHDPFMGSGTTLMEAARLGAEVSGTDVDPVATEIARLSLDPPSAAEVARLARRLRDYLAKETGDLFAAVDPTWQPLHYFYLHRVQCPGCSRTSLAYRSLILAKDVGKSGAVRRDAPATAFCPSCLTIHQLASADATSFSCCDRQWFTGQATFTRQRFHCDSCGRKWKHKELGTGVAPRVLVAVEETSRKAHRRIRSAAPHDLKQLAAASVRVQSLPPSVQLPSMAVNVSRIDERPLSYGVEWIAQLFTDRQLLIFGHAFAWLRSQDMTERTRRALMLGISNALATNNKLCGYATDYGRLSPLFSVRSYALPLLSVELNPLHDQGGRGTLRNVLRRLSRAATGAGKRYVWSVDQEAPVLHSLPGLPEALAPTITCGPGDEIPDDALYDLLVFDPPYFDYIAYSELSEFFRAWWPQPELGGKPLLPDPDDPVGSFGRQLGTVMREGVRHLRPLRPVVFTYHSANPSAWDAVGQALDDAELAVTALWPLRNDAHMGHHSFEGNCEWDVVVVCRRRAECESAAISLDFEACKCQAAPLSFSLADEQSLRLAARMAEQRGGVPIRAGGESDR